MTEKSAPTVDMQAVQEVVERGACAAFRQLVYQLVVCCYRDVPESQTRLHRLRAADEFGIIKHSLMH